jgi:APA family basic amino acid/polyamine antiporter
MSIWKTKPLSVLLNEASEDESKKRTLSARSLVALGVGAIIELDCSLTGIAAAENAGPAVHVIIYISSRWMCICRIMLC